MNLPSTSPPRIAVAGTGRAARAVIQTAPGRTVCVFGRHPERARQAAALSPGAIALTSLAGLRDFDFDVLWILTSDAAIAEVLGIVVGSGVALAGRLVAHSSGMLPLKVLAPARDAGAAIVALHPAASLTGMQPIPSDTLWAGSAEGVDLAEAARWLLDIPGTHVLPLSDESRPLYHAASSAAANYSVTLFALSVELFRRAGIDREAAALLVRDYLEQSAARSAALGPAASITGPIVRGDAYVVAAQLEAVRTAMPEAAPAFETLAHLTQVLFGNI